MPPGAMAAQIFREEKLITPSIAICVPVRNEEAELPALLDAVLCQVDAPPFRLCLYFDNCTDASEAVADAFVGRTGLSVARERSTIAGPGNAGRARAAAMALGLREVGASRGAILLSTDADSAPAADWVAQCAASLADVEVAAGRIVRRDGELPAAPSRLEAYLDALYALRRTLDPVPWDTVPAYHHRGGANLAIRAADYVALGGFAALVAGEDARLLDDASRAGLRVRHDPRMVVTTSARRIGRVPGGLADVLRDLDSGIEPLVGDPAVAVWQYRMHAAARRAFGSSPAAQASFAQAIGLTADHCIGVARDCPNAEAFAMRIVPLPPSGHREVALAEAERQLAALAATTIAAAA